MTNETTILQYGFTNLTRHEAATLTALVAQIPNGQAHQHDIGGLFPKLDAQLREQDAANAPELYQAPAGIAAPGPSAPVVNLPDGRKKRADHAAEKAKPQGIKAPRKR